MKEVDCGPVYEDAEFYDAEFHDRREDVDYYLGWALRLGGAVLELACGTGRITIPIARAGARVEGLDVCEPMLRRAERKSAGLSLAWHHGDCRMFRLPRRFDWIFMATNALQHLHDRESVDALFERVRAHLNPGGKFLFDVMNPNAEKLARDPALRYRRKTFRPPAGEPIDVDARSGYDPQSRILEFDLFYSKAGRPDFRTKHVELRCFFPQELDELCRRNGFAIESKHGDYKGGAFDAASAKQVLVCVPIAHS